jgi:hypothetical protein
MKPPLTPDPETAGTAIRVSVMEWRYGLDRFPGLTPAQHHTALTIANYMSRDGDECEVSKDSLRLWMRRKKGTVNAAVDTLEQHLLLQVLQGGGRGNTNRYAAVLPAEFQQTLGWGSNRPSKSPQPGPESDNERSLISLTTGTAWGAKSPGEDPPPDKTREIPARELRPEEIQTAHPQTWLDSMAIAESKPTVKNLRAYAAKVANTKLRSAAEQEAKAQNAAAWQAETDACYYCGSNRLRVFDRPGGGTFTEPCDMHD